jgi:hypothetical protein
MNTSHRLVNGSREPVGFLAVTNAPLAFDMYRDPNFFNCPTACGPFPVRRTISRPNNKRYVTGLINIWKPILFPIVKTQS